jgi:hypothetical protein
MDILEQNGVLSGEQEPVTGSRLIGLESRVEHVASATFSNLQYVLSSQYTSKITRNG